MPVSTSEVTTELSGPPLAPMNEKRERSSTLLLSSQKA